MKKYFVRAMWDSKADGTLVDTLEEAKEVFERMAKDMREEMDNGTVELLSCNVNDWGDFTNEETIQK